MKKIFKFVLWAVLLIVVVGAIGAFVFVKTFDLNRYKTQIAQIVYEQTGRKLSLNGNAGLKISLIPTIELNDVTFSNASWAKEPNMISAKAIDVAFSVLPLLKKEIVIDKVHLIEPKVYLELNEKGVANWDFSKKENTKQPQTEPDNQVQSLAKDTAQGAAIVSVLAKSLKIDKGEVVYQDLKTNTKHELKIKNISLKSENVDSDITADIDVVYNNEQIKANIVAGSINSVLQNAKNYPLKANVKAFGATAEIEGVLSDLLSDVKYDLKIKAQNPNGNFGAPAVKLNTTAKGNLKNVALNVASLDVATNEIKGTINADIGASKPVIKANLNSELIDLQKFSQTKTAQSSFNFVSTVYAANFVPDTPIDLSFLNLLNANLTLDVKKLVLNQDISFDNIKTDVVINGANANVNIKSLNAGGGNVTGTVSANTSNNFKINLKGNGIILQNLIKGLAVNGKNYFGILSGGKTDLSINLNTTGNTVRKAVENLNGQLITVVGESKIQTGDFKYLSGNFVSQILGALQLQKLDKSLDVSCAVLRTDIANGKAVFPKGIAFKSNRITVVSDGVINLKNDKIDFSIKPFNGKLADTNVAQAISSMLKVSGTVEKPRLAIDNSSVIKNVVGIAATGPAFLGSQMLLDVDDYPCYTALKGTTYENMFEAPSGVKAAGQSVYQGASDVVTGGINLVNDAAKGVLNLLRGKK
ncbi:MAG: AsmA family protein [Alphaproteobacteria bacterium]|nr:AsmA family protein [Alphaproteobacteria bacterium]